MGRRTKDQRRTDYLDIGASIVAEASLSDGAEAGLAFAHVKLALVAERAGVTKGALYHLWPSQEDYWRDLLHHLVDTHRLVGAGKLATVDADVGDSGRDGTLREYANSLFDSFRDDPAFFARISLFSYLDDELVRGCLDREFRTSIDGVLPVLAGAVTAMGRRPRSDDALRDLAVSISSLLEGLCLRYRISPGRAPDLPLATGRRWTLFAAASEALLLAFTEPTGEPPVDGGTASDPLVLARTVD
jgi:AcrR family transcriptional regulator